MLYRLPSLVSEILFGYGTLFNTRSPVTDGASMGGTSLSVCEACILGKHPRAPHPPSSSRAALALELIHSDICGPFPIQTPHGKLYFSVFLDDRTHALELHLLSTRDQVFEAFKLIHRKWEVQFEAKVKVLRVDNAGEYLSGAFTAYLHKHGIQRELSTPYAHQQNGRAKRVICTIEGRVHSMLSAVAAPRNLWGEAALTCAYLFMRTPSRALPGNITPYEAVHGTKPNVSNLCVWGCRCFVRIPTELQTKLGEKSRECVFMSYPNGVKGYRVRDKSSGVFFNSRDVIFDESSVLHSEEDIVFDAPLPTLTPSVPDLAVPESGPDPVVTPIERPQRAHVLSRLRQQYEVDLAAQKALYLKRSAAWHARHNVVDMHDTLVVAPLRPVSPVAESNLHIFNDDYANLMCEESALLSIRSDRPHDPTSSAYDLSIPPATFSEARRRPDFPVWEAVAQKEFTNLLSMGVYQVTTLPSSRCAIGSRWVFEFKLTDEGPVAKARLVAKGFSQLLGIDFTKTFAPVAKATSICLLAAIACTNGWHLDCFDATRAFLWGDLEEEIYMRLPDGFVLSPSDSAPSSGTLICRLLKSMYGLKQASRIWYAKIRCTLERIGFTRSDFDHALFHFFGSWHGTFTRCIIALHVDDGMGGSDSSEFLAWVKSEITKEFGLKDLGAAKQFLEVEFVRNLATKELWMHQASYVQTLLDDLSMGDCNAAKTPMDTGRLDVTTEEILPDRRTEYQTLIGKLLFLSICTRPDISYAVNSLAQHSSAPRQTCFDAIKRVIRYLKGTASLGLHYKARADLSHFIPRGYSDSDWAGEKDRRSVSGFVWFYGDCLIDWGSKKQQCVALSSTKAEYVVLTTCIQSGIALRSLANQLGLKVPSPTSLRCDNEGAISLSSESSHQSRVVFNRGRGNTWVFGPGVLRGEVGCWKSVPCPHPGLPGV